MKTGDTRFGSTDSTACQGGTRRGRAAVPAVLLVMILVVTASSGQDDTDTSKVSQGPQIQNEGDSPAPSTAPRQVLHLRITRLTQQTDEADVDDAMRRQIRELLTQAGDDLDVVEDLTRQNATLQEVLSQLPQDAKRYLEPSEPPDADPVESMSIVDLEQATATVGVSLASANQELERLQQDADSLVDRKRILQEELLAAEQTVDVANDHLQTLPDQSVTLLDEVQRAAAEASRLKAVATHDLARNSLARLNTEVSLNLPSLRIRHQQARGNLWRERHQALQIRLDSLRKQQSRQELDNARRAEDQLKTIENVEIRALGELRIELAKTNDRITQQDIPHWQQTLERREVNQKRLTEKADKIRARVEKFGTDTTLGRELLHFGSQLPSLSELRAEMDRIDELTSGWRHREMEYEDTKQRIDAAIHRYRSSTGEAESEVLDQIPGVLTQLKQSEIRLFSWLGDVNGADRNTIAFIERWTEFSSEHALWLRSHDPVTRQDFVEVLPAMRRGVSVLGESVRTAASRSGMSLWVLIIPAALAIIILLAVQPRAKEGLMFRGEEASRRICMSLRPTVMALLLSMGLAAEWPLFLMLVGTMLDRITDGTAVAPGQALIQFGGIALWLNFFRQVLRPGGLASSHLKWNSTVCNRLRRWLRLVFLALTVPMFLFLLARHVPDQTDISERILFLLLLTCSAAVLCRLFFPFGGPFVYALVSRSRFLYGSRYIWIPFVVSVPLILALCSATGFHHTALSLWDRLGWSVVTATGVILGWSLVLRWLRMFHRGMRMELARQRAQERDRSDNSADSPLPQETDADDSELVVFGTQARLLVRNAAALVMIGCAWAIWFDILPALRVVDRYELWSVQEQVSVTQRLDSGEQTTIQKWDTRSVTVGNLLLVTFALVATFVGVRQLPGLVGVVLLQKSSFDSGVRYTITTVIRYIVLIVGTTFICHSIGLRWSQVQWLVAGLSVGLGFGLQEVFANFVSGIIILVERPLRIGDVVTIDGVSGVVSRIQIRATSITDWDRREYIVPNRELVTGKLLNWTLSDSTNRILISVGIGYSSDPDRARATMLQVANQHSNVLDDPSPVATFEEFGDSSLNLVLRAYLPDMENRLGTITELHTQIHRSFAEEGIDIPFPQREVRML